MKFLIISWYFPPWNEVACGRPHSWARWFAEQGHEVTVITPKKDTRVHGPLSMRLMQHPNLFVEETPLPLRRVPVGKAISWMLASVPKVVTYARNCDVVISTYPFGHNHFLGRVAKAVNPLAVWCADYRDLWHDNYFFTEGRPLKRWVLKLVEKALMRRADLNTTVSEPLARRLERTHPHVPSRVIYNGFEERDMTIRADADGCQAGDSAGPFRIVYTGTIYRNGYQNPEPLFAALATRKWKRAVRLSFFGPSAHEVSLRHLRQKYGLDQVVDLPEKYLSREESLAAQRSADLLLHLGWTDARNDGWLSGKVFEYMASGTPVLSVGAGPDSALGKLLKASGSGICIADDVDQIVALLEGMIDQGRVGDWFNPSFSTIRSFTREAQASRLLGLLTQMTADRVSKADQARGS